MNNERSLSFTSNPADVAAGDTFQVPGHQFKIAKSEVNEEIFAIGIELINIFPAFRAKLSDCAVAEERAGSITEREYQKCSPAQIHQHSQFEILNIIFWRDIQVPHVMYDQLC